MKPECQKVLELAGRNARVYIGFWPCRASQVGWSKKHDKRYNPRFTWALYLWFKGYLKRDSRWTFWREYGFPGTHLALSAKGKALTKGF